MNIMLVNFLSHKALCVWHQLRNLVNYVRMIDWICTLDKHIYTYNDKTFTAILALDLCKID